VARAAFDHGSPQVSGRRFTMKKPKKAAKKQPKKKGK
jgi:hypothetical protein